MFESFPNLIFVLIAIAVFIGRTILQARGKSEQKPRIPVHFEDEKGDNEFQPTVYSRSASGTGRKFPATKSAPLVTLPESTGPSLPTAAAAAKTSGGRSGAGALPPARQGAFNISHLPPLKQAVVMAEILGTPKGLL